MGGCTGESELLLCDVMTDYSEPQRRRNDDVSAILNVSSSIRKFPRKAVDHKSANNVLSVTGMRPPVRATVLTRDRPIEQLIKRFPYSFARALSFDIVVVMCVYWRVLIQVVDSKTTMPATESVGAENTSKKRSKRLRTKYIRSGSFCVIFYVISMLAARQNSSTH